MCEFGATVTVTVESEVASTMILSNIMHNTTAESCQLGCYLTPPHLWHHFIPGFEFRISSDGKVTLPLYELLVQHFFSFLSYSLFFLIFQSQDAFMRFP